MHKEVSRELMEEGGWLTPNGAGMSDLPDPFVSDEIDLHGFSGFMLDVDRLLASELVALGTPEECWAALMLWCRAWKQSPPGSLPTDDRVLAAFSGAGTRWKKVKAMALRGFVLCSDGRLYHRVLADEANAAWHKRKQYQNDQDRLRKWRARNKDKGGDDGGGNGRGNGKETPPESGSETRFKTGSLTVGQGQGQGQGQSLAGQLGDSDLRAREPEPPRTPLDGVVPCSETGKPTVNGWLVGECFDRCLEAARANPVVFRGDWQPLIAWLRDGYEPAHILAVIERRAKRDGYYPPNSLMLFDSDVRAQVRRVA